MSREMDYIERLSTLTSKLADESLATRKDLERLLDVTKDLASVIRRLEARIHMLETEGDS